MERSRSQLLPASFPQGEEVIAIYSGPTQNDEQRSEEADSSGSTCSSARKSQRRSISPSPSTKFKLGAATFGEPEAQYVALGFQITDRPVKAKRTGPLSKQHTLIGEDGKYKCPFCQRPFQRRHDAQRHSIIHTKDKPYICHGCNASFPRADRRAAHWKKSSSCWARHHQSPELTPVPLMAPSSPSSPRTQDTPDI